MLLRLASGTEWTAPSGARCFMLLALASATGVDRPQRSDLPWGRCGVSPQRG